MVFFYLVTTGWIFDIILLCENSIVSIPSIIRTEIIPVYLSRLSFSDLCILLFLFLSLCRLCVCVFSLLSLELGRCSSDLFFCPADHVPDWQPRVLLGMVEARSVNVKKTTTTTTSSVPIMCLEKPFNRSVAGISRFDSSIRC